MAEYERIINKLRNYLADELGFKKDGEELYKELKKDSDILISERQINAFNEGVLYGGNREILYESIEENYIVSSIEEKFDEVLLLTDKEKAWLSEMDEDGVLGWDMVSEWIWNHANVTVNRKAADRHIATANPVLCAA